MKATILLALPASNESVFSFDYMIGAIIALFILGYLIYSLIKPEKF